MEISDQKFQKMLKIVQYARDVQECNDAGECYTNPSADGAQCLSNLLCAVNEFKCMYPKDMQ